MDKQIELSKDEILGLEKILASQATLYCLISILFTGTKNVGAMQSSVLLFQDFVTFTHTSM